MKERLKAMYRLLMDEGHMTPVAMRQLDALLTDEASKNPLVSDLTEWCDRDHLYPPDNRTEWQQGFLQARREVRAILDKYPGGKRPSFYPLNTPRD